MRRCLRVGLVGVLAILMTIDTAVACRWFGGRRIRRSCECMPCPPMPSCGHDMLMPDRPPVPPEKAPLERPRIDAEPPTKADVKEPVDEPIKEPPVKEPPVKEPAAKKDALEDLFDTPTKEDTKKPEPPADTKKEEPAAKEEMPKEKEKVEDLFDTPKEKPDEKAKETPSAETPATKEEPADAKAKVDDLEKLFESDKKKAEEPKTEEPPPAGEKKADSTEASPAKDAVDDLFEDPPKKASDVAVVEAPATVQPVSLASIKQPLPIEAQERNWRDDTGQYGCRGRLVLVTEGKVRILKDNGRFTTVPFDRLSEADLEYVRQEATRAAAPGANVTAQK